MKMSRNCGRFLGTIVVLVFMAATMVRGHEVTYRGTVMAAQPTTLQVKTVDEKSKKEEAMSFVINKDTKVRRGDKSVPYGEAKIVNGERIAVTIDHDAETKMLATEIRLAAR